MSQLSHTKDIACGEDHSLIIDNNNNIWAFGLNYNGQLGLGHNKLVEFPEKLTKFTQNKIKRIESEGDVSFAITDNGEVYMWPIINNKRENIFNPRIINLQEKITNISCGGKFVLFLTVKGMIYSMGTNNSYGQLGHGDTHPRLKPSLIEIFLLNNERISQISCGFKHCVAKSYTYKAYTWGLVNFY